MKANPIPPDEASWGRFDVLLENNQKLLRSILEDAAAHASAGSPVQQKVGTFYQSCMNEEAIEKLGATPSETRTRSNRRHRYACRPRAGSGTASQPASDRIFHFFGNSRPR